MIPFLEEFSKEAQRKTKQAEQREKLTQVR